MNAAFISCVCKYDAVISVFLLRVDRKCKLNVLIILNDSVSNIIMEASE